MNAESIRGIPEGRPRRAAIFSALGDPIRLGIADLLQVQDLSPDALSAALDVPGNLLAHHLKVLESAGVVSRTHSQHDKRRTYVHLLPGSFAGLLATPEVLVAPRVVFVCTHNSARSVLAQAMWQALSDVPSASAGTEPADRVNPRARSAARRAGLTIDHASPHSIDDVLRPDDVLVSVCDAVNESLDRVPNPRLHWSIPDPSRVDTDSAFDSAVVEISQRVSALEPRIRTRTHSSRRRP